MPMRMSGVRQRGCLRIACCASAISAMMPPSPRLSARMISTTYFSDTTTISAQKIVDRPPRMLSVVSAMPWSGENVSFTAYSGLVPMSPNTTPSAASVRAGIDDLPAARRAKKLVVETQLELGARTRLLRCGRRGMEQHGGNYRSYCRGEPAGEPPLASGAEPRPQGGALVLRFDRPARRRGSLLGAARKLFLGGNARAQCVRG